MSVQLLGALEWHKSLKYMWARIGPCSISIKRWRESKTSPWMWSVHEVFGTHIMEPGFDTPEAAQGRAVQIACDRFALLRTYFRVQRL